ncbi:hypothetical protein KI688_008815 [Linnemannia hyalina]|uniref:Uncharacterized protein n=1 Tax=Linnemannia hyalina TaxID=64524 RepID=A0A9P7Y107_9FUNG|nr:hypothetical protein KI688_008815 [Linnemannia hyalina]
MSRKSVDSADTDDSDPDTVKKSAKKKAIRSSSNKVLYDLLARKDSDIQELTVRQHKVKLLTWQKFIVPDIGYDGAIGLRPAGWKPPNPKQRRTAKKNKDIEEWIPESSSKEQDLQVWTPDDADAAIARSEELEYEEHEDEDETVAAAVGEVVDVDMEIVVGNMQIRD